MFHVLLSFLAFGILVSEQGNRITQMLAVVMLAVIWLHANHTARKENDDAAI